MAFMGLMFAGILLLIIGLIVICGIVFLVIGLIIRKKHRTVSNVLVPVFRNKFSSGYRCDCHYGYAIS